MEFFSAETARQLLLMMAIFWAAYWLLRVFLFRPVYDLLEQRRTEIATALEIFERAKGETEAELDLQRSRLAEARGRARSRRDELRKEAQARRQEILAEAKRHGSDQLQAAQVDLDRQVATARLSLEREAERLAEQMTERLLERAS